MNMTIVNPLSIIKKSLFIKKVGNAPDELVYVGDKEEPVNITLTKYTREKVETLDIKTFEELIKKIDKDKVNWINLDGVGDVELIRKLSEHFKLNELMASDILNTSHHPKSEEYDEQLFTTLKMVWLTKNDRDVNITSEHISIVLGDCYVITFQDKVEGDTFDPIRNRINTNKGKIRRKKADYLFYALIDNIVDHFFLVMEYIREEIEDLEDSILTNPSINMNEEIIKLRRKTSELRRTIYMIHDAVTHIINLDSDLIRKTTYPYFGDVVDHTKHLNSDFESFRDYVTSLMDLYMSNLSNDLNIIMKTLTIFSLFFVPLTFLAGIYGMNFEYMPELKQKWGYPIILALMLVIVAVMYSYIRRKKWL